MSLKTKLRRSNTFGEPPKRRPILKTFSSGDGGSSFRRQGSSRRCQLGGTYKTQSTLEESIATFVDAERMPFLAQKLGLQDDTSEEKTDILTVHLLDISDVKINTGKGGILGEGDYTRTHEIKSFKAQKGKFGNINPIPLMVMDQDDTPTNESKSSAKTTSDIQNARQYAIKCINPIVLESDRSSSHDMMSAQFGAAVNRLVREALYLSHLQSHPFILPFRGWCFRSAALREESTALEAVALITDRLGDTLEMRMKTWKQLRTKRGGQKEATRQKENFILGSLQMDLAMIGHDLMHKVPRVNNTLEEEHCKINDEAYPVDLVALQTNYILQAAHALEYLHWHGIVVRDLRPNTVGFKEYPHHHTVQLFHFGFCRELPSTEGTGSSSRLIPPEPIQMPAGEPGSLSLDGSSGFLKDDTQSGALAALYNSPIKSATTEPVPPPKKRFSLRRTLSNASNGSRGGTSRRNHKAEGPLRSPRLDAKHYRAPETYPVVRVPRSSQQMLDNSSQNHPIATRINPVPEAPPSVIVSAATSRTLGVGYLGSESGRLGPSLHRSGTNTSSASNTTTSSINSSQNDGGAPPAIPSSGGPAFGRSDTIETTGTNLSYSLYSVSSDQRERQKQQQQQDGDPYKYQYKGYDGKADIYSLAMIYYEMMAEGKPYGKTILARDSHYYRVQSLGLRPPLRRHHFPRTVKAVLEQAWNPVVEQRPTAKELTKKLATILHMFEGRGISPLYTASRHSGKGGANSTDAAIRDAQDLEAMKKLPTRAKKLMISVPLHSGNSEKVWSSVWDQKQATLKLNSNEVEEAIQAQRVNNKDQKKKKKPSAKKTRPGRAKSLTNWLSSLKMGAMMESEVNSITCEALLGKDYKEKRKALKAS